MKKWITLLTMAALASFTLISCGGSDKEESADATEEKTSSDVAVPNIDLASLTNEASILDAMQQVVDARTADEKMQDEDPEYEGHYVELTKLYADVLNAATEYSKTLAPEKTVEFNDKLNAITAPMYE
jgi:hypothetical protein